MGVLFGYYISLFYLSRNKSKTMKEYILTGEITISVYTRVEAETLKEAIEIASERDVEKSEWNSHRQSSYCWVNDEYDGDIVNVKEEE